MANCDLLCFNFNPPGGKFLKIIDSSKIGIFKRLYLAIILYDLMINS